MAFKMALNIMSVQQSPPPCIYNKNLFHFFNAIFLAPLYMKKPLVSTTFSAYLPFLAIFSFLAILVAYSDRLKGNSHKLLYHAIKFEEQINLK